MTSNALLVRKLVGEDVCFGKKIAHPSKAELGFPQPPGLAGRLCRHVAAPAFESTLRRNYLTGGLARCLPISSDGVAAFGQRVKPISGGTGGDGKRTS